MMKKMIVFGAAGMLAFVMGTAVPASTELMQVQARTKVCTYYVDRNHDGICDRCSNACVHRKTCSSGHHSSGHHSGRHH